MTPNGNSSDTGYRLNNTYRVGTQSMAFANSMYSMDNKVQSWATDLNSRFTDKISNQLLFTYTNIEDMRGTNLLLSPSSTSWQARTRMETRFWNRT